ncbi:hypothetical protein [Natrinema soli]|uniref:DUF2207 domain-containing protein n=1 Tax=Natrinema soli TaxID=1930624 RepID=A0ABD5SK52_9EURY|nr:hypothetical protein [Natrinema soli]
MANETLVYTALLLSMVLGAVIVVGGIFFQNGIGAIAALGSVFILLCVGGLAYLASESETEAAVDTSTPTEKKAEESELRHESKTG